MGNSEVGHIEYWRRARWWHMDITEDRSDGGQNQRWIRCRVVSKSNGAVAGHVQLPLSLGLLQRWRSFIHTSSPSVFALRKGQAAQIGECVCAKLA